jgi:hypothetical protein
MSTEHGYKLCPECRTEYTLVATRCADCDVDLVAPHEVPAEEEVGEPPPASELQCGRGAPLAWTRALSGGLQQTGVVHRIETAEVGDAPEGQRPGVFGNVQLFGLYVRDEHVEPAQALDGNIAAQLLPEEAPAIDAGEEESCPACGTALEAHALECPDCGLTFG